ncbi:MAG: hypothetical protein H5T69_07120 [Chloroflexi bacterium]|nr:hypothetical protein [Chloroflexota bacterium]
MILRLAESTLLEVVTREQVIVEVQRLRVLPDPSPADLVPHARLAHEESLPMLVVAALAGCPWLVTFNVRRFAPGHLSVTVLHPTEFLLCVRDQLARLGRARKV